MFQGCFKDVSRTFQGRFKEDSSKIQAWFKEVSSVFYLSVVNVEKQCLVILCFRN